MSLVVPLSTVSLVVLALAVMMDTRLGGAEARPEKRAVQMCGKKLVKLVTKICRGCIQGPSDADRVELTRKRAGDAAADELMATLSHFWAMGSDGVLAGRRQKRGIVEECCYDPCSYKKIKKYCCSDD